MQSVKTVSSKSTGRTEPEPVDPAEPAETDVLDAYDTFEMFRVICPDCAQPIALLADEDVLPEHALCPTPWNPFGLTVCSGTGRDASLARPADESLEVQEQDTALLLTLPQGLDWRTQPFSHVGGPGSRPLKVPPMRRAA
ncbi:hypothetical protein ACH46N_32695 [Streptomyces pristinaespiralis]|jgi:hypothetical protein|uniref:Uncharacterized protein n=2 Tax=Streptomyces pristinaespiralis TaxID=38300 RepID=B5HEQ1_STRE2|nr:hypothetical protein [Streptomyces pristinaespiralis]ALC24438.1 hypothetical protein SPRI_6132 [Streptomyces pristinaespiralis]EDY65312.1 conserved hypothetical protein [Streptomyces pristinaespiralis ATCC 25486]QMU13213.1 hypothetical protein H3L99_06095 [Streptomyces pristinaespiralis]